VSVNPLNLLSNPIWSLRLDDDVDATSNAYQSQSHLTNLVSSDLTGVPKKLLSQHHLTDLVSSDREAELERDDRHQGGNPT